MGEGWEGVMAPVPANRDTKKHPLPGAHARVRELRRNITDAERSLWRILRLRQVNGYRFRRQVPLGRYNSISRHEAERTAFLQEEGYRVLRFWNNDVLGNLSGVYDTIVAAMCDGGTPTQTLPHQGGGI
jgi:very-short-patch-repair endonuclease